jgi:predicted transcriptional regulator
MEIHHLNQKQLAQRWQVSEACLERWRHEKIGPDYLKLHGRVLYRQQDIEAYELRCLKSMRPQADSARP